MSSNCNEIVKNRNKFLIITISITFTTFSEQRKRKMKIFQCEKSSVKGNISIEIASSVIFISNLTDRIKVCILNLTL